jgi:hypothetical protein
MLEIKCPVTRKIAITDVVEDTCPIYYFCQVQQQLEVCDLDECDFWQCKLYEYKDRQEFVDDTDSCEPFRSKKTELEKGCLIQLMPRSIKIGSISDDAGKIKQTSIEYAWEYAKFIHPPKIEMTPADCDQWICKTMSDIATADKWASYYVDRVIYWRMDVTHCVTIPRDRDWFTKSLPKLQETWEKVVHFRKNADAKELFSKFLESIDFDVAKEDRRYNSDYVSNKINKVIDTLVMLKDKPKTGYEYNSIVNSIKKEIEQKTQAKKEGKIFEALWNEAKPNKKYAGNYVRRKKVSPQITEKIGHDEFDIIDI